MPGLVHCIYSSVQTYNLQASEIDRLVRHSRESNQKHDITGILLHIDNTFFQVLEGPSAEVDLLYDKILKDPRHTRITQIIYEPVARRFFGDSVMSLAVLSPSEFATALDQATPETAEELLASLDEGRAKRLIRAFGEGRWRARLKTEGRERVHVA